MPSAKQPTNHPQRPLQTMQRSVPTVGTYLFHVSFLLCEEGHCPLVSIVDKDSYFVIYESGGGLTVRLFQHHVPLTWEVKGDLPNLLVHAKLNNLRKKAWPVVGIHFCSQAHGFYKMSTGATWTLNAHTLLQNYSSTQQNDMEALSRPSRPGVLHRRGSGDKTRNQQTISTTKTGSKQVGTDPSSHMCVRSLCMRGGRRSQSL